MTITKRLNVYDVVSWELPGDPTPRIWVVTWSVLGSSRMTLSEGVRDFRSEDAKAKGSFALWVLIEQVGLESYAAVDVDRIFAEGTILNSSVKEEDDDPENCDEIDHFDEDDLDF